MLNVLAGACKIYGANGANTAEIPAQIVGIVRTLYNLIKIGVPILLVFLGMLDFAGAVLSQKEDDIKKNQKLFVKRLIAAVLVFFVLFIVQTILSVIGETGDIWSTIQCVLSGN